MKVLALVPARAGSRGIPGKNVRELAGRPLIAWTLEAALAARRVDRTVVSTDDPPTATIAETLGGEVPFLRPPELAADDTPDLPVCRHALDWLARHGGYRPDAVVWLRPTAPLRTAEDVDAAIEVLERSGTDAVRSVCLAEYHPYWMKLLESDRLVPLLDGTDETTHPRRQVLPEVYRLNGAVDAVRCSAIADDGPLFGGTVAAYIMPRERSVDIDDELDLAIAELLIARGR